MAIIITQGGKNAKRLERQQFEHEKALQEYIHENPEALPVEEIGEGIRLLVMAREFPTNSGPIDALGVDGDGEVYIIETKLYKNPDKRLVLAQVLDYGASLWKTYSDISRFRGTLEELLGGDAGGLVERLRRFFKVEDEMAEELIARMQANVQSGRFRFVILMDELEERLKDLIQFMNENSEFSIYGVKVDYYKCDSYEIMIPSLYGAEVKKSTGGGRKGPREGWTRDRIENALDGLDNTKRADRIRRILKLLDENRAVLHTGFSSGVKGKVIGRDLSDASVFVVFVNGDVKLVGPRQGALDLKTVQDLLSRYSRHLKWSEEFDADLANRPQLVGSIEDLSDEAFDSLLRLFVEFAGMRAQGGIPAGRDE